MATLNTKTFAQLVNLQASAIQSAYAGLADFGVGSILRALSESVALVTLWIESLIIRLLASTRLSTSAGSDVDTWVGDFGLSRLSADYGAGNVTFSRFSPTAAASVPAGTIVGTADGSAEFQVIADASNPAWNAATSSYDLAIGVSSIVVTVRAVTAGVAANVAAGAVTLIKSAIAGVDTVTNAAAFAGGSAAETDAALKARFVDYLSSLSKATPNAIGYAIQTVSPALTYRILEHVNLDGSVHHAYFAIIVDDGTGAIPSATLTAVGNAVEATRAAGVAYAIFPAAALSASVELTVKFKTNCACTQSSALLAAELAKIEAAIKAYIVTLGISGTLHLSRIAQLAFSASDDLDNVYGVKINSVAADITASSQQVIQAGAVNITVA